MADLARKHNSYHYIYNDYLEIDDGKRYEVIDGELYMMSSPSRVHQEIVGEVYGQIREKLKGHKCTPYVSPMDVRLFYKEDGSDDTIVQPDVFVVCDETKKGENSINGAPDLVIEVLSPSNSAFEMSMKLLKYQDSGVKEYWMIDAEKKLLVRYSATNGVFMGDPECISGVKESPLLGLELDFDRVLSLIEAK
jgi:Uma2 family endonuclease